ncbi:MAG: DUF721 domain-containing protein [Planctomycetes bacterium]|nr:DUF721 domain-containing protein [Planctomycetota bacterium]
MTDPQRAGELLRDILSEVGQGKRRNRFNRALDDVLSEAHRRHCQVVSFRGGKLVVEVDSAPLFAELSGFRREELRLSMNERLPEQPIAQLTFRLGGTGHV